MTDTENFSVYTTLKGGPDTKQVVTYDAGSREFIFQEPAREDGYRSENTAEYQIAPTPGSAVFLFSYLGSGNSTQNQDESIVSSLARDVFDHGATVEAIRDYIGGNRANLEADRFGVFLNRLIGHRLTASPEGYLQLITVARPFLPNTISVISQAALSNPQDNRHPELVGIGRQYQFGGTYQIEGVLEKALEARPYDGLDLQLKYISRDILICFLAGQSEDFTKYYLEDEYDALFSNYQQGPELAEVLLRIEKNIGVPTFGIYRKVIRPKSSYPQADPIPDPLPSRWNPLKRLVRGKK
jgi:hypothetical protein